MATQTIYTSKDTRISGSSPNNNYGGHTTMRVGGGGGDDERELMEFDITSAPAASLVSNVSLKLYCTFSNDAVNSDFERITGAWTEGGVTWSNQPAVTITNKYNYNMSNNAGWEYFDITNLYKDAKNAGNSCGIRIRTADSDLHYNNTKENASNHPYILITYTLPTDFYVKASGGSDSNDGLSWANAWATINKAATTVTDGSTVHIGFGTYNTEPANNDIAPVNAGSVGIKYLPETETTGGGTGSVIVEVN